MKLTIAPVNESQFEEIVRLVKDDLIKSGIKAKHYSASNATEIVESYLKNKLPEGKNTDDQIFRAMFDPTSGGNLGYLWISKKQEAPVTYLLAYLYVFPRYRRQGVATQTMNWLDEFAEKNDVSDIILNVFASNQGIQEFYSSVGFNAIHVGMTKTYKE